MRSRPAPGTWTSFRRFAAAPISWVNASVTSTSTSESRETMPISSPTMTSHGIARRARTGGSRLAENVPANATWSMTIEPPSRILHASGQRINSLKGNGARRARVDHVGRLPRLHVHERGPLLGRGESGLLQGHGRREGGGAGAHAAGGWGGPPG